MQLTLKQISSLEKIRSATDLNNSKEIFQLQALAGERVSYQISMSTGFPALRNIKVSLESDLKPYITLYSVKNVVMDMPATDLAEQEDYITLEPGVMPDLLMPLTEQEDTSTICSSASTLWVRTDLPKDIKPGIYSITVTCQFRIQNLYPGSVSTTMQLEVLPAVIPDQKLIYTRWFHADCIANYHQTGVYTEAHWTLIEKYIEAAVDSGMNMILVPVHTPPVDTEFGTTRTCVQLVDIEKKGEQYLFNFEKFSRFIEISRRKGIKYFEIAHMFSQGNSKYSANIMVTENNIKDYMFGWKVEADSPKYTAFLQQYIPAICSRLVKEGIADQTYFHISDEPKLYTMDAYKRASDLIRPLLGGLKTFDALSNYEIYEKGLVECPVTGVNHIHDFLPHPVPNQWTYYCCGPQHTFTNSFMAMPSSRTRIIGFQMYRYDIKGFLHWGLNFYSSAGSGYALNPYTSTSCEGYFPSGDPFILYPGRDTVYGSIRSAVFYEALQDIRICEALEQFIGRDAVVQMIDDAAGYTLRFDKYPKGNAYLENLRSAMLDLIKKYTTANNNN